MKKLFALLLCLVMTLGFAACEKDESNDNGTKTESSIDFSIQYNSVKIELGADANAVLSQLGAAKSQSEMGACGDQGTVTKYTYDMIELYVLKNGDKATVDQITILGDLVKAKNNVTIGTAKDDVIKAFGDGYAKCDDNEIRYTNGKKNIKFQLRDGSVVAIDYMMLG